MGELMIGILGIVVLFILLFSGISVGIAMILVGFTGFAILEGLAPALGILKTVPYSTAASYGLTVIPLFVLMGQFAFYSGISQELYAAARTWLGHLPGGLAMASIGASAGFSSICGSSPATTATLGAVSYPEMKKSKYNSGFAAASIAAGGTLGIMIPPSNGFILYGIMSEQSIGKLFLAGIIPGIILAVMYMITIYFASLKNPEYAPQEPKTTLTQKFTSLKGVWPIMLLFGGVIGGILGGIFTANEAAGIGAFGAFLFMIARKKVNKKNMVNCLTEAMNTTAMIFMILIGAYVFGYFLTVSTIPQTMSAFLTSLDVSRYIILLGILCIYILLGCVMDSLAMVVLTTPIFFPVIIGLGFDPIWYGVMMVVAMEQGQITPPVGINLFVIYGVAKDAPMKEIYRHIVPYIVCILLFMILLVIFPQVATFLPDFAK